MPRIVKIRRVANAQIQLMYQHLGVEHIALYRSAQLIGSRGFLARAITDMQKTLPIRQLIGIIFRYRQRSGDNPHGVQSAQ